MGSTAVVLRFTLCACLLSEIHGRVAEGSPHLHDWWKALLLSMLCEDHTVGLFMLHNTSCSTHRTVPTALEEESLFWGSSSRFTLCACLLSEIHGRVAEGSPHLHDWWKALLLSMLCEDHTVGLFMLQHVLQHPSAVPTALEEESLFWGLLKVSSTLWLWGGSPQSPLEAAGFKGHITPGARGALEDGFWDEELYQCE
ncbi:unnamed protein product [Boreogadus saida]